MEEKSWCDADCDYKGSFGCSVALIVDLEGDFESHRTTFEDTVSLDLEGKGKKLGDG